MVKEIIDGSNFFPFKELNTSIYQFMFHKQPLVKNDSSIDKYIVTTEILLHKPSPKYILTNLLFSDNIYLDPLEAYIILSNFTDNTLEYLREVQLYNISLYDISTSVNSFNLKGKDMWLPKDMRVGLVNSITMEKNAGKETTVLWYEGISYELPVDVALNMLLQLELYALLCYNVTAKHKSEVDALTTVEELIAYDYKADYPEKLVFE